MTEKEKAAAVVRTLFFVRGRRAQICGAGGKNGTLNRARRSFCV